MRWIWNLHRPCHCAALLPSVTSLRAVPLARRLILGWKICPWAHVSTRVQATTRTLTLAVKAGDRDYTCVLLTLGNFNATPSPHLWGPNQWSLKCFLIVNPSRWTSFKSVSSTHVIYLLTIHSTQLTLYELFIDHKNSLLVSDKKRSGRFNSLFLHSNKSHGAPARSWNLLGRPLWELKLETRHFCPTPSTPTVHTHTHKMWRLLFKANVLRGPWNLSGNSTTHRPVPLLSQGWHSLLSPWAVHTWDPKFSVASTSQLGAPPTLSGLARLFEVLHYRRLKWL